MGDFGGRDGFDFRLEWGWGGMSSKNVDRCVGQVCTQYHTFVNVCNTIL